MSLLEKGIIIPSQHEPDEFISPIFLRDKQDGLFRMILNLKKLNKHVQCYHFKMETIKTVISMMTPDCFMASIDLKDAYYCVPVSKGHQKYLKFQWNGSLYQFTCYPNNGLACCPVVNTVVNKKINPFSATVSQGITFLQCPKHCQVSFIPCYIPTRRF